MWEGFHSDEYLWIAWQLSYRASNRLVRMFCNLLKEQEIHLAPEALFSPACYHEGYLATFPLEINRKPILQC